MRMKRWKTSRRKTQRNKRRRKSQNRQKSRSKRLPKCFLITKLKTLSEKNNVCLL
jgi:hypothetical protein